MMDNLLAQADLRSQLHGLGQKACQQVLDGKMQGLAGRDFAAEMARTGLAAQVYCDCVGRGFEIQTGGSGDEDPALFMERLLINTLSECVIDPNTSWAEEFDVAEAEDFAYDEHDVRLCQSALDDELPVPGFNPGETLAQLRRSGQSREDLCTCAGRYIAAGGEPLQEEIASAAKPSLVYFSTLAGAINVCMIDDRPQEQAR